MKEIPLTQGKFAIVDDNDYEMLSKFKWCALKDRNTYYAFRGNPKKKPPHIRMHRQIMNAPDGVQVDHINSNGLDNRKSNLRLCDNKQNQYNRGKPKNNTSGYKGVCFNKRDKKYYAHIFLNGKQTYIGQFTSKHEAALAYNTKAVELHGEFAKLNIIRR